MDVAVAMPGAAQAGAILGHSRPGQALSPLSPEEKLETGPTPANWILIVAPLKSPPGQAIH